MCLYPITVKTVDSYGMPVNQSVPCGKCIECLKDRQNSWKIRLVEESRDHLYCYFFTLTYRNETALKIDYGKTFYTFRKQDIQKWLKRSRTNLSRTLKRDITLRYFICSEYGPNTGRGHFHGLFFSDVSPRFIASVFNDWIEKFGFVDYKHISNLNILSDGVHAIGEYLAKYCCKVPLLMSDVEKEIQFLVSEDVLPAPFYVCSKGIGLSYVDSLKRYHRPHSHDLKQRVQLTFDRAKYHSGAFTYKLPRYYKERLFYSYDDVETNVYNPKSNKYEKKKVKRYRSKTFIARALQVELRNRLLDQYNKIVSEYESAFPLFSRDEIDSLIEKDSKCSAKYRESLMLTKMSRFYNTRRFKNRRF